MSHEQNAKMQKVSLQVPSDIYLLYKKKLLTRTPRSNTTRDAIRWMEDIVETGEIKETTSKMIQFKDAHKCDEMTRICISVKEDLYIDLRLILIDENKKVNTLFNEHVLRTLVE